MRSFKYAAALAGVTMLAGSLCVVPAGATTAGTDSWARVWDEHRLRHGRRRPRRRLCLRHHTTQEDGGDLSWRVGDPAAPLSRWFGEAEHDLGALHRCRQ